MRFAWSTCRRSLQRQAVAVALLMISGACVAMAQDGKRTLTLRQAIDIALVESPLLQAAQHQVEATQAGVTQARAGFLPTLDFTEAFTRADNPVFAFSAKLNQGQFTQDDFDVGRLNNPEIASDFTTRLSLRQSLFTGGRVTAGWRQAQLQRQASEQGRHRQEQQVIFQVAKAYYDVLRTQAELEVARSAIRSAEANRKLAQDRFETGLAVASDMLSAKVRLATLKEGDITARHEVILAHAALNDAMGTPLDTAFEIVETLTQRPSRYDTLEGLAQRALERRPDYQQTRTGEQASERGIARARAAFFPTIGATASYDLHHAEFADEGQDSWFVGVALEWNLFNGFADSAKVAEAQANKARLEALRMRLESRIKLEVKQSFLHLQAARERVSVASGAVSQAEESLRIFRDRYETGIATIVDLLTAETALTRAKGNLTHALYDYNVGLAGLELTLGAISADSF
jgi:outer membrane protein